jgi:hypothetical protein
VRVPHDGDYQYCLDQPCHVQHSAQKETEISTNRPRGGQVLHDHGKGDLPECGSTLCQVAGFLVLILQQRKAQISFSVERARRCLLLLRKCESKGGRDLQRKEGMHLNLYHACTGWANMQVFAVASARMLPSMPPISATPSGFIDKEPLGQRYSKFNLCKHGFSKKRNKWP